jgi:DNA-binding SARP family transcriptional activator
VALIKLCLLDRFALSSPQSSPSLLPVGTQRLVAFLALAGHARRTTVAGGLWPEVSEDQALHRLRTAVWRIHKVVPDLLVTDGDSLSVSPSVDVDYYRQQTVAAELLTGSPEGGLIEDFAALLPATLLPGWDDEWVALERDRLRQLRLHALEEAVSMLLRAHRESVAFYLALEAVRAAPLRESAHAALIRVHLAEGNASDAAYQHRLFSSALREQLGVDPSPRFGALLRVVH